MFDGVISSLTDILGNNGLKLKMGLWCAGMWLTSEMKWCLLIYS